MWLRFYVVFFLFKQSTAYEMRISDWSSDVCSSDLAETRRGNDGVPRVGGSNAGGSGQPAIKVVGDVTRAGYNLVNGRGVTDSSSIAPASCSSLSCQTWTSPQAAVEWGTREIGRAAVGGRGWLSGWIQDSAQTY